VHSKSGVYLKDSLSSGEHALAYYSRESVSTSDMVLPMCAYADNPSGNKRRIVSANSSNGTRGFRRRGIVVESR